MNDTLLTLFISAFATLFVVLDPPGCVPIFSSLTNGASVAHRRAMAIRSVLIASGVLIAFALGGEAFLGALGISLPAFKIAGGVMVFLIAIDMVFEKRTERRENRAEGVKSAAQPPPSRSGGRRYLGLPDGDPDARRARLDCGGDAAVGAQPMASPKKLVVLAALAR